MDEKGQRTYPLWIRVMPFVIVGGLILILLGVSIVGPGERGIKITFGSVEQVTLGEGLHFKIPIVQDIKIMDVKTQKKEARVSAASKDLQVVSTTVVVNYNIQPDAAHRLFQEIGTDYESRIVEPAIQESVKATTAKFTAEQLITQRPLVKAQLEETLKIRLASTFLNVTAVSITEFNFSDQFNASIEAKVTEEQNVFKAENQLRRIEIEAQQTVTQARAESDSKKLQADATAYQIVEEGKAQAEALRLQREQINAVLNDFKAIEAWNGVLPTFMGGGVVPFVNLGDVAE